MFSSAVKALNFEKEIPVLSRKHVKQVE